MSNYYTDRETLREVVISAEHFDGFHKISAAFTPFPYLRLEVRLTWRQIEALVYSLMQDAGCRQDEVGSALVAIRDAYERRHAPDPIIDPPEDNLTDADADADTLASAGHGTDEDYGGGDERL